MAERRSGVQDAHPGWVFERRTGPRVVSVPAGEPCQDDESRED